MVRDCKNRDVSGQMVIHFDYNSISELSMYLKYKKFVRLACFKKQFER